LDIIGKEVQRNHRVYNKFVKSVFNLFPVEIIGIIEFFIY